MKMEECLNFVVWSITVPLHKVYPLSIVHTALSAKIPEMLLEWECRGNPFLRTYLDS